ncbi:YlbF family regulator [Youxingia wuxianensis]|uniref:YlbF family regulator n=1 Tax=Youxingia wuxianensis TaxID=2763678 RepID=A0A926EJ52_9FIRM|nr:YlbF family regulator [Youxingia wuxianensis]MBC8584328.1 YlbF family regulator [Youxingia wuxianensis]
MDVILAARQLGKAIQQDERYLLLRAREQQNDNDQQLQKLIGDFNLKRIDLNNELNKEQKDQEAINRLNDEIKEIYGQVMSNENMANYNQVKNEIDSLMNFIMQILRGSVNGEDPDLIEEQANCTGSCSSCGGCH